MCEASEEQALLHFQPVIASYSAIKNISFVRIYIIKPAFKIVFTEELQISLVLV